MAVLTNAPYTGNPDLDSWNTQVTQNINNPSPSAVQTGTDDQDRPTVGNLIVGYQEQFLHVRYATSADGSVGFTNDASAIVGLEVYQGVRNSNSRTESNNPADYTWRQITVSSGWVSSYQTTGGRQISWNFSSEAPIGFTADGGDAIDLDLLPFGAVVIRLDNITNNGNAFFGGAGQDKTYRATVEFNGSPFTDAEHLIFRYDWFVDGTAVLSGTGMREYTVTATQISTENDNELQVDCVVTCE